MATNKLKSSSNPSGLNGWIGIVCFGDNDNPRHDRAVQEVLVGTSPMRPVGLAGMLLKESDLLSDTSAWTLRCTLRQPNGSLADYEMTRAADDEAIKRHLWASACFQVAYLCRGVRELRGFMQLRRGREAKKGRFV